MLNKYYCFSCVNLKEIFKCFFSKQKIPDCRWPMQAKIYFVQISSLLHVHEKNFLKSCIVTDMAIACKQSWKLWILWHNALRHQNHTSSLLLSQLVFWLVAPLLDFEMCWNLINIPSSLQAGKPGTEKIFWIVIHYLLTFSRKICKPNIFPYQIYHKRIKGRPL